MGRGAGQAESQYSSFGFNAGVRGNECGELPCLVVGPEVSEEIQGYNLMSGLSVHSGGACSSHGPGLVQFALFEVFWPQSEGRDTILALRDVLREEV